MSWNWILYLIGGGLVLVNWLAEVNNQTLWAVGLVLMGVGCIMDVHDYINKKKGKNVKAPISHKPANVHNTVSRPKEVSQTAKAGDPLIERAFMLLEDSDWNKADELFEQVLNSDPKNAKAYIGKLCVELHINRESDLFDYDLPVVDYNNYKRALQFADEKYKKMLERYALTSADKDAAMKKEEELKESLYKSVLSNIEERKNSNDTKERSALVSELQQLGDYKDAPQMLQSLSAAPIRKGSLNLCPTCEKVNASNRASCFYCGVIFINE